MKAENGLYKTKGSPVYPVIGRAIKKLGQDISLARRARRISAESFAQSMGSSRATLYRLEKGDPGVSINTLAMALNVLGRLDLLETLFDQTKDDVGLMVMRQSVPIRVTKPRIKKDSSEQVPSGPITSEEGVEGW